jgi:hypothetical protein
MANRSTNGFGFKAAMRLGNTPAIGGQSKYVSKTILVLGYLKTTRLHLKMQVELRVHFKTCHLQQLMIRGAGGLAYAAGTDASLVGVFNGAFFIDSTTLKPTFANSVAAGTTFGTNPNTVVQMVSVLLMTILSKSTYVKQMMQFTS